MSIADIQKHRAKQFNKWLDKKKWSAMDFALIAGVSYNTVIKWKQGRRPTGFTRRVLKKEHPDCPIFKD